MLDRFRTYKLAVEFHRACDRAGFPLYLREQMLRASSSIALNLAEGSGRSTRKDQVRFFYIALGSLRECQAAIDLMPSRDLELAKLADQVGAHLFKLCKNAVKLVTEKHEQL